MTGCAKNARERAIRHLAAAVTSARIPVMEVGILAQGARRRGQHRQAHRHGDDDAQADTRPHNRPRAERVIRRRNHQGIDRGRRQHESGCRRQGNTFAQQRTENRHRRAIAHRKKESRDERRQHGGHRVRRKHARDQSGGDESLDELGNEHAQQQEGNRLQGHTHGDRRRATNGHTRSGQGSLRRPHANQCHQHKRANKRAPGTRRTFRIHHTHPTTLGQARRTPPCHSPTTAHQVPTGSSSAPATRSARGFAVGRQTLRPVGAHEFLRYTGFSLRSGPLPRGITGEHPEERGQREPATASSPPVEPDGRARHSPNEAAAPGEGAASGVVPRVPATPVLVPV